MPEIQPDEELIVEKVELELTCTWYCTAAPPVLVEAFHCKVTAQELEQVALGSVISAGTVGPVVVVVEPHGVFTFHCWVVSFPSWHEPTLGDGLTAGASLELVLYPP